MGVILEEIWVYPIKSLPGLSVKTWEVVNTGLQFDRQWMLIDQEGQFLSQRRLSVMARLATAITNDRHLKISAMGLSDYFLPLAPTEGHSIRCTIWGDWCTAWHVSTDADLWFSTALN